MEPFQVLPEGIRRYLPAACVVRDALRLEVTGPPERSRVVVETFARDMVDRLGVDGVVLRPLLAQASDDAKARHETMLLIAALAVVMEEVDDATLEL